MKILFLGRRYLYFRNFDTVIRELASRGHQLHLAVEKDDAEGRPLVAPLLAEFPNQITCGEVPSREDDDWTWVASRLRLGLDYFRYEHPAYDDTAMLRERARERTPGLFIDIAARIRRARALLLRPATALLRLLERSVPPDPAIDAFIAAQKPDAVLITPLIDLGSSQIDYLRASRAAGIPTALCVWSWDHLSSKALIRELPDRVFVWNYTQQKEALQLHGVPPSRVVVTGAQNFDKWFDRQPSRDRATFCAQIGLPANRPYILYVCSAPFIGSPPEAPFVADWVRRIRESSHAALRDLPILVRPHPSRAREWDAIDMTRFKDVVVWGSNPIDTQARADYFDSLYHSAIVAGLNTSAFIEAGIVGRPVYTILLPEWHENQLGTLHFRYLFEAGGGLLNSARSFDEHLAQLDDAVRNPSPGIKPFVHTFVRPHGLDTAATPIFVSAVESLAALRPTPLRRPLFQKWALARLEKMRALRHSEAHEAQLYSERELEGIHRLRDARNLKAQQQADRRAARVAEKEARVDERARLLEQHRAAKAARDAARKQERLSARDAYRQVKAEKRAVEK